MHRILVISHGHPVFSKGGAEIVAYNQFTELNKRDDCEALFLARHGIPTVGHGTTPFGTHNHGSEVLVKSYTDFFLFSQTCMHFVNNEFRALLERFRPTAVHFHHYLDVGIELLRAVRNYSADIPIVLTLHEYLAICNNLGQMIKPNHQLCWKASPAECHVCIPSKSPAEYLLRELYLKSFFVLVDTFIAPSQFLLNRYLEWGLPRSKMVLMENGQVPAAKLPPRSLRAGDLRGRFAYFGQIDVFKGVDVLLEAFAHLPHALKRRLSLEIHGGGLDDQPAEYKPFQDKVYSLLEAEKHSVRYFGKYEPHELPRLMERIDWVVVPSIWWENSPLVIQEAMKFGRPVICADIGGMAEKVIDRRNGLHFRARNSLDLAARIEEAATTEGLWDTLYENTTPTLSISAQTDQLMSFYRATSNVPL